MPLTFITGPVRSGKSRFALELARESGRPITYIATATPGDGDPEWLERIERHRLERAPSWALIETAAPGALPIQHLLAGMPGNCEAVVESTGTWLAARIDEHLQTHPALDAAWLEDEAASFAQAAIGTRAHAIVVGEEIGWGLVPESASLRAYRDVLGRLHQRLARAAARSFLVVSGFALELTVAGRLI